IFAGMAAADAGGESGNLDPRRERARTRTHAGAGRGAHRYRRDVHAAEPSRVEGRTIVRRTTDPGVDRSQERAGAATWLCLCRLGTGILRPPQRLFSELRRPTAAGEYRRAGPAAVAGKWRLGIFCAPDRRAAVEDEAAS